MARTTFIVLVSLFTGLFLGGFVHETQALEKVTKTNIVKKVLTVENLVRVADNVVILFDSSGTMNKPFGDTGMTRIQAAKKILQQRAEFLPGDFPDLNVGLYTYSPPAQLDAGGKGYGVIYSLQPFKKAGYQAAVAQLPEEGSGPTLIINALRKLDRALEGISGRTVVFLFTDGTRSDATTRKKGAGEYEGPLDLAKQIAQKHDVNFQIISTAEDAAHKQLLASVAAINEASRVHSFEAMLERPEVFSGAVFVLEESYIVSAESRSEIIGFKLDHILYDFGKSDIGMEFTDELKAVGEVLKNNPASYVVLSGHTDNVGPEEFNLALSHQRVEAVGAYLADKFAIDMNRISMFWYGEAAPVASNDTAEGRKQNRRVVGFIGGVE